VAAEPLWLTVSVSATAVMLLGPAANAEVKGVTKSTATPSGVVSTTTAEALARDNPTVALVEAALPMSYTNHQVSVVVPIVWPLMPLIWKDGFWLVGLKGSLAFRICGVSPASKTPLPSSTKIDRFAMSAVAVELPLSST